MKGILASLLFVVVSGVWAEENSFFDVRGLAPTLVNYTGEVDALALAQTRRVVYFFAADWCELCAADLHQLKTRPAELPADVTVVLVDYENSYDLKKKYGVPLQDVFVQIDKTGKRLIMWVGGGLASLKKNLKS